MHQKSSSISCDVFLRLFSPKINDQRLQIPTVEMDSPDSPAYSAEWSEFQPINTSILQTIVQNLKPTFCENDMMPSRLLKQAFDCVSQSILHLINRSLCTDEMKNYRPISQLPFESKILEKVVLQQLLEFFNKFYLRNVSIWV